VRASLSVHHQLTLLLPIDELIMMPAAMLAERGGKVTLEPWRRRIGKKSKGSVKKTE